MKTKVNGAKGIISVLLCLFCFSSNLLFAQGVETQGVEIKDTDDNILMKVEDEGLTGSIFLNSGIPPILTTYYKLYNVGGTLNWNGYPLGGPLWLQNSSDIYYNTGKVGIGIASPTANLHVVGIDGALFTGTLNSGTIPIEGAGIRMMWYPKKAAFRVGRAMGTEWNDVNIGFNSTAMGVGTTASGDGSFAVGKNTTASGYSSVTMGKNTTASGDYSLAVGTGIEVSGEYSVAIALDNLLGTIVTQPATMAIMGGKVGIGTIAPAADLHVAGVNGTLFTGNLNIGTIPVEGAGVRMMWYPNKAAFRVGRVDGTEWNDVNIGFNSTAMGVGTTASGDGSFAVGKNTTASGYSSVAMGKNTTASGDYSLAVGTGIEVSGEYSVAIALDNLLGTIVTQPATMSIMGGKVGIGTVAPYRKFEVHDNINSYVSLFKNSENDIGDGIRITLQPTNPDDGNRYADFMRSGGTAYAGWICGNGSGGVVFSTTSDARLKMNIEDYEGALEAVSKIRVKQYEMKSAPGKEQIGFLAQELLEIYPQAVSGDPNGNVDEEPMGIDYGRLTPLLVKAIQEQQEMIAVLQAEIELLKKNSVLND